MYKMLLLWLVGFALVASAKAGCREELMKDSSFLECLSKMSSIQASDMSQLCSESTRDAIRCMTKFQEECPEIPSMELSLDSLEQSCNQMNSPCMTVSMCISNAALDGSTMGGPSFQMEHAAIPYVAIPYFMNQFCGQMKAMMDCVKGHEDQCPDIVDMFTNTTETVVMAGRQFIGGTFPETEAIKAIINNECPNIPQDFSSNKCVNDNLDSKKYIDCMRNVDLGGEITCEKHDAMKECLRAATFPCGANYYNALLRTGKYFLPECQTAASDVIRASLISFLLALCLTFLF